jgi:hypothetical protein
MRFGALLTHGTLSALVYWFYFMGLVVRVSFPFVLLGGFTGAYGMDGDGGSLGKGYIGWVLLGEAVYELIPGRNFEYIEGCFVL